MFALLEILLRSIVIAVFLSENTRIMCNLWHRLRYVHTNYSKDRMAVYYISNDTVLKVLWKHIDHR